MARQKIRVGIIGNGMIGKAHLKNFMTDNRSTVSFVADIDDAALQHAREAGVPKLTTDYRQLLADGEVDAVVVSTPPDLHFRMAMDTMRAGKHLMVEKPMTAAVADARRLVAEGQRHRRLMLSDCSARHSRLNPKFAFVRDMIESGELGEVYFIHHNSVGRQGRPGIEYHPAAKWFLDRKRAGGGPMVDWGVYDLSFHLGVLGDPKVLKVESAMARSGMDRKDPGTRHFTVEEHAAAMMTLEGGVKYYWERASNAHNKASNETRIYGTRGGLRFTYTSGPTDEIEFFRIDRDGKGKPISKMLHVNLKKHPGDMVALGKAMLDAICGDRTPPMPLPLAAKHLEIIHKLYQAANW